MTPTSASPRAALGPSGGPDAPVSALLHDSTFTLGDWATEAESTAALDQLLERLDLFSIYREVTGYYLQPRIDQELKRPRIDRVLIPKPQLIAAGWHHGAIGIECKKSNIKMGPAFSQLIDYSRATWQVETMRITLPWVFLWPLGFQFGTVASIQAHQRVGSATPVRDGLVLSTGTRPALGEFRANGEIRIGHGRNGLKTGSR